MALTCSRCWLSRSWALLSCFNTSWSRSSTSLSRLFRWAISSSCVMTSVYQTRINLNSISNGKPGQSHLNNPINKKERRGGDKIGRKSRRQRDGRERPTRSGKLFCEKLEDPRMERTRAASLARYHHSGDLWSPVRSRGVG